MNDTSGVAPTPWNAMGLLLGAHLALLIGGGVVIAAGGWEADDLPIGGAFLVSVPFWVAGAQPTYDQWVELAALLVIAALPTGGWSGLDHFLSRWFPCCQALNKSEVRR